MSTRWMPILLSLLGITGVTWSEEVPSVTRIDLQRLQTAGLSANPDSLLPLVRSIASEQERQIPQWIEGLRSDEYDVRHQASRQLAQLGRPARGALANLLRDADPDVRLRAQSLIEEIESRLAPSTLLAILRTLCRSNHPEAAGRVLEHLPDFSESDGIDLLAVLLRVDPTAPETDRALRRALADANPRRREAAGLLLARRGTPAQRTLALSLLQDENEQVRFRIAQGLIGSGDERGIVPLVAILEKGTLDRAWQAEELLRWIAAETAPAELVGNGTSKSRTACRNAWEKWLAHPGRKINWTKLRQSPVRPGLFLICRHDRVEILGSNGEVRYHFQSSEGGIYTDAHLLPGGRLMTFDDNEAEVRLADATGKVLWKWRAPGGEIALNLQPLLHENRVFVVTDEQLHELTLDGKHERSLRLGEKFFSDACLIDADRIIAITDEGFFVVDRATGGILSEIQLPNQNDLFDSGRLYPLPEGMVAVHSARVPNVFLVDPAGRVLQEGPATKPRQIWGVARYRWGNWLVGGNGSQRLAEQADDGRVVREVIVASRPTRFRPTLEDLRLGLDDFAAPPFNLDSAEYRIASLKSANLIEQRRAASMLGQYRDQASRVIPALIEALDADDETTRFQAGRSLAQLGPIALPDVRKVLKQGKLPAQIEAARGIGQLGKQADQAVPELTELLRHQETAPELRVACSDALGQVGEAARLARPILSQVLTERDATLRRSAARSLGQLPGDDPAMIRALVVALEDPDEAVAVAAAQSLARFGKDSGPALPTLVRLLQPPGESQVKPRAPLAVRARIAETLGLLGSIAVEATPVLVACARNRKEDQELRAACIRSLGQIGPLARDAVPALREILLSDPGTYLHGDTFRTLIQLRHVGGLPVLMEVAKSGSEAVRYSAITSLGAMGTDAQPAVPLLQELNTTEKNLRVRSAIQRTLRRIPSIPAA